MGFLESVHKEFSFLTEKLGFRIAEESSDEYSNSHMVWYSQINRFIGIGYQGNKDAEVTICIGEIFPDGKWGQSTDILSFIEPNGEEGQHYYGARDPEVILNELKRLKCLLQKYCAEFLNGDLRVLRRNE